MSNVIKDFKCKVTKNVYKSGTTYAGDRSEELQKLGYVEGSSPEWPKHSGGGHYELSNGDKVKGKDAAMAAQSEIDQVSNGNQDKDLSDQTGGDSLSREVPEGESSEDNKNGASDD